MIDIVVKGLQYEFDRDKTYEKVKPYALESVREAYQDEQDFQNEEYEAMLQDGEIFSEEDYIDFLGNTDSDINYLKPFEENQNHPEILRQIENTTQKYLSNYNDVPKKLVVSIDENELNSKGFPSEKAVKEAVENMLGNGISVAKYDIAMTAEKKDLISQNAYDKIGEMISSKDYQTFLDLRSSIGKYSSNNISMIYAQKPDAKAVMGFHAWLKLDRCVEQGQNGIAIWQPCKRELKTEKQIDSYIEKNPEIYGKPDSDIALRRRDEMCQKLAKNGVVEVDSGYRLGYVFDIAQTASTDPEHDNLEDIVMLNKPLNKELEGIDWDDFKQSLTEAATLSAIAISPTLSQQEAVYQAVYDYADKVFSQKPEQINGIKSNEPLKGDMHTIETAMTAHMICSHMGIDCGDKTGFKLSEIFDKNISKEVVAMGKREMFSKSFDRAIKLSDQFTKAFDKAYGIDIEAKRDSIKEANQKKFEEKQAARKNKKKENIER